MPGMKALPLSEAKTYKAALYELKIDGSRLTYKDKRLVSDRGVDRSARYAHVHKELLQLNAHVRGEMAISGGNVLQLNKRENWSKACYYIFDVYSVNGKSVEHLSIVERRLIIEKLLRGRSFMHISIPLKFNTFDEAWKYVERNNQEGVVLKTNTDTLKCKRLLEIKVPIVGHVKGKSKGAFVIDYQGVRSKVSGTSDSFIAAYKRLLSQHKQPYAEVEFQFLTDDGVPFQPRLRRLDTLAELKA